MKNLYLIVLLLVPTSGFAWNGYDYEKGSYVEIEKGNLVRQGKDIEVYDYSTGQYNDVEVQAIRGYGSSTELDVYNYNSGEYRTLYMDRE